MARLTPHNEARARDLIALYPHHRSALIPILHVLQEQDGYLTEDGMEHVGEMLGLTGAEVRGTATFYDMFHVEPVGRYLVAVCTNIACLLQGAYELLESAEETLGVAPGGTTADGMFTLEDAECLALCGNAPCLTVNWRFFGDVDPESFRTLVADLRSGALDAEVPHHGVLSRVERTVGLEAQGMSVHGAGGPPLPVASDRAGGATGAAAVPAGMAMAGAQPAAQTRAVAVAGGTGGSGSSAHDQGVELATSKTTTAVVALDGGRGLDATGTRTTPARDSAPPDTAPPATSPPDTSPPDGAASDSATPDTPVRRARARIRRTNGGDQ